MQPNTAPPEAALPTIGGAALSKAGAEFAKAGLAPSRLGGWSLIFFGVSASAPMTVLAGGVVAIFATTGNLGAPLAYPIIGILLALFSVGYAAMSRHVINPGVFYAYISKGLSGAWGVSAAVVALVAYNAIQIGLYGLFGEVFGVGFIDAKTGLTWPWEAWAFIVMAIYAILGLLRVDLNAKIISVLLAVEILVVVVFDVGGFAHPGSGPVMTGLEPSKLFVSGIGGVFAFVVASYTGFESVGDYGVEARDPRRTVGRAILAAVAVTTVLYTISAWALETTVGSDKIVSQAQDPNSGIPFSNIDQFFGGTMSNIAFVLLGTSIFAAMLSFHNTVARYFFSAGRERVLPRFFAKTSTRSSAPIVGSSVQTLLAVVVVLGFWAADKDPVTSLFTWLSYVAAVGILLLMIGASAAALVHLNRNSAGHTLWQRTIAPVLSIIGLAIVLYYTLANSGTLLGAVGSTTKLVLPGIVVIAAVVGLLWGLIMRATRRDAYDGIGQDAPVG